MQAWTHHKGELKQNFPRLVQEAKAQLLHAEQAQPAAAQVQAQGGVDDNGMDNHSDEGARSDQEQPPLSPTLPSSSYTTLKPMTAIVASIRDELGLPESTSIPDTIAQSMAALGLLEVAGATSLKDKAVRVAQELNIAITRIDL